VVGEKNKPVEENKQMKEVTKSLEDEELRKVKRETNFLSEECEEKCEVKNFLRAS
jgi:hypothetical protein